MPVLSASETCSPSALQPLALSPLGSQPLVSILVGNFNYAQYIGEAIESVFAQTYAHWELVICDDGSTDDSVAVIERYACRDSRIRLIEQYNGGHAAALNTAFSRCGGEIICLLDSDDLYRPEKLERVVQAFTANPERGFLVHRLLRIDANRKRQGVWPLSDSLPEGWLLPELLRQGGLAPYMPPTSGLNLRREVAQALFPLSTTAPLHACPDQVVMRIAPLLASIAKLSTPLAEYRLHGSNAYSSGRITADSVQREITLSGALWREQSRILRLMSVQAALEHERSEKSPLLVLLQYLRAKLSGDPETRDRHRDLLSLSPGERSRMRRLFWSASVYLPRPVFRAAINLALGQNWLKQMVARMRGLA